MRALIATLVIGISTPALAQHQGHDMPMPGMDMPAPKAKPKAKPPQKPKSAPVATKPAPVKPSVKPLAKPATAKATEPPADAAMSMDHGTMDHGPMDEQSMSPMDAPGGEQPQNASSPQQPMPDMDHSMMNHGAMAGAEDGAGDGMDGMTAPMADETPPPEAGSGPARAADAIWGADAMRGSRQQLATENGGMKSLWVMADRAEYRVRNGKNGYLWDGQGYYGGDIDKFWFKTEGEGSFGQKIESAEAQALWSHAIAPFFDFQAGVRQDFAPRDRTYAVVGIQGLAPYLFELDAAAFLSDRGDATYE